MTLELRTEIPKLSKEAGVPFIEGTIRSTGPLSELPFEVWDLSHTIPELAYLTHNYFRYYGKFPSTVAAGILNRFAEPGQMVGDNYCGSGTTLVEAALRGMPAVGVDINPFAVLAANVKTHQFDPNQLRKQGRALIAAISEDCGWDDKDRLPLFDPVKPKRATANSKDSTDLSKWFSDTAQLHLSLCKQRILKVRDPDLRQFFLLAFFAVIRRVSRAFDGEVRPHINKAKKPRNVVDALNKKISDMIKRAEEFNACLPESPRCVAIHGDSTQLSQVLDQNIDLMISHPPYMNCFDYLPVFRLEFLWADGVKEVEGFGEYKTLRANEVRAWPTKNTEQCDRYFDMNLDVYREARKRMQTGGRLFVVIGDSTIQKELVRVHERFATVLGEAGFRMERVIYRTTHYGTGKYAYGHRADYHNTDNSEVKHWAELDEDFGKRDAILVARAH